MQSKFLQKVIVSILTCLQLSRNQQSRCTTYTMNRKFIGSLREDRAKPLWEIEKESVDYVMYSCVRRCESEQRCVGIEICTIRSDLARGRGCCEWYVEDKNGDLPRNATEGCKYYELNKDDLKNKGTKVNVQQVMASSVLQSRYFPNYAVDGVNGGNCSNLKSIFITNPEQDPWLRIDLPRNIVIWRVLVFNRFNCCGERLVNLNVTYSDSAGVSNICGFYPGISSRSGDLILFQCPPEAQATSVKIQIESQPGSNNELSLCEVEIYEKN